jgi:3-phosphoshikimate 1-carboxyvinyltransferase
MTTSLKKTGKLKGFSYTAWVPGSKSYTNRALVISAQKIGTTIIRNALICDDTKYLANALNQFEGIEVTQDSWGFTVTRSREKIGAPKEPLYVGGAGTPARFLIAFAATAEGDTTITGNPRLSERPMGDILDALSRSGISWAAGGKPNCLPVTVQGSAPSTYAWSVNGNVSSQFVSALILLAAQQSVPQVEITVTNGLVSVPYVEMTLAMLRDVGIKAERLDGNRFVVIPKRPTADEIVIETDASGMSYALTAAAITGASVKIEGIGKSSAQGDLGLVDAYVSMGCSADLQADSITLVGGDLKGIDIDMDRMPDVVLSLAIAATQASSPTRIRNIANLRVKECDRISAIANELARLGIKTDEGKDEIVIYPAPPVPGTVHCYDDHRVAMAFSLLGLLYDGIEVDDPGCVKKSFPEFWQEMGRFCEEAAHSIDTVDQP